MCIKSNDFYRVADTRNNLYNLWNNLYNLWISRSAPPTFDRIIAQTNIQTAKNNFCTTFVQLFQRLYNLWFFISAPKTIFDILASINKINTLKINGFFDCKFGALLHFQYQKSWTAERRVYPPFWYYCTTYQLFLPYSEKIVIINLVIVYIRNIVK